MSISQNVNLNLFSNNNFQNYGEIIGVDVAAFDEQVKVNVALILQLKA